MSGRKDSARNALARVPYLHPAMHEPILAELDREALLDEPRSGNGGFVRAVADAKSSDTLTTQETVHELRAGSVRTMMAAAEDRRNVEMLRILHANAKRLGIGALFTDYSKPIDVDALNVSLRDKPEADRWRFKDMCYSLRLIPA
jgi:hypothetical protein